MDDKQFQYGFSMSTIIENEVMGTVAVDIDTACIRITEMPISGSTKSMRFTHDEFQSIESIVRTYVRKCASANIPIETSQIIGGER